MIVVDTNIVAYLLIESDQTAKATEVRRLDPEWIAPALWLSEFRSVLMLYLRRNELPLDMAISLTSFADEKVESRQVDSARVIELAFGSGCTTYDCEFISLAERLNIPLVTSEKKVLAAFPQIAQSMDTFAG